MKKDDNARLCKFPVRFWHKSMALQIRKFSQNLE